MTKDEIEMHKSPVIDAMQIIWQNTNQSWLRLNSALHSFLCAMIESGMEFHENDFSCICSRYNYGFWFGTSLNGKHMGEGFYKKASIYNNKSASISYEKHFNRLPFLTKTGSRVFEGQRFWYAQLCCHVTGWSEDNQELKIVGYENWEGKGQKKLMNFTKKQWLEARKEIEIASKY